MENNNAPSPKEEKKRKHHPQIEINPMDEKKKASLSSRLLVAGILIALAVPAMILGGWYYFGFVSFFLIFAIFEMIHAPRKKYGWYVYAFTYLITLSYVYWFLIKSNVMSYQDYQAHPSDFSEPWRFSLTNHFTTLYVSIFGIAVSFGMYSFFAILHKGFGFDDVAYLFSMSLFVGLGFQALLFIRYYPVALAFNAGQPGSAYPSYFASDISAPSFKYWGSVAFFVFVVFTTLMNDTGAYFTGMLFGKHHMNERISPNKTWEGFVGGCITAAISGFGFAMITDALGFPVLPSLKIFGEHSGWWWTLLICVTIPLIGNLGDFTFSLIKRHFKFKDYGTLLKAHGGVLDRADSLTFCSIFAAVIVIFITGGWNFFA